MRSARYHFFPLYVLCSLIGTVAYYFLVLNINNSKLESFFSWFGKNSMSFLCTNQFVIMVLDILLSLFLQVQLDGILIYIYKIVQFILTMIICATFDIIISKTKLKYVIGK